MADKVIMYTDGACRGNPGPGGWGVILHYGDIQKTLKGFDPDTTNNRMELTAVIEGLRALRRSCSVDLNTDSKYVLQGINVWIDNWKSNGWKTAGKKQVKNVDLWQLLEQETVRHRIIWHWVKAHSGIRGNEMADQLANQAIDIEAIN
ncbi:MAG: ribonuclease HI [Gammaproteobacteria bacterium]|nr:MAG: ribonuclease HI [Gammaproteobacteria bacterium]